MNLKELRIGYVPYLPDLSQPGDRRRFPHFAKRQHIPFEIAQTEKEYDIVLLTATSNQTKWLNYKRRHPKTKFIFEMVDSLVFPFTLFSTLFKGVGRYLIGKESRPLLIYDRILHEWIRIADCVICSNEALKEYVLKINNNAILSLDYLQSEYSTRKQNFEIEGKIKLVWEGQSNVLPQFFSIKNVLKELSSICELHVITTEKYPVISKVYFRSVHLLLDKLPIDTYFHKWDINTHTKILASADCAIIPIDSKNKLTWAKPANKLISFWFTGIPSLVSATPAYKQLMDEAGTGIYCSSTSDWINAIHKIYKMSPVERMHWSERNFHFANKHFSDTTLDEVWKSIFTSVIELPNKITSGGKSINDNKH